MRQYFFSYFEQLPCLRLDLMFSPRTTHSFGLGVEQKRSYLGIRCIRLLYYYPIEQKADQLMHSFDSQDDRWGQGTMAGQKQYTFQKGRKKTRDPIDIDIERVEFVQQATPNRNRATHKQQDWQCSRKSVISWASIFTAICAPPTSNIKGT